MIRITLVLASLFSALISSANPIELSLTEATEQNVVDISATARRELDSNNFSISLKNLTSKELVISIPTGTLFRSDVDEFQDMLIIEPSIITLTPQSIEQIITKGFCIEASDLSPQDGSRYSLKSNTNEQLDSLVNFVSNHQELLKTPQLIQSALWAVTDDHDVSPIYADGHSVVEELRKLCCRLTGQDDVWYNTHRKILVNAEGRIVCEPFEVNGKIKLSSNSAAELRCFLVNEQGEEIWSYPGAISIPAGEVETWFKLTVKDWPKGVYTVYYQSETETLLAQEFQLN